MSAKIFLIAGEPSGDVLGGGLIHSLQAQSSNPIEIYGIGGEHMQAAGLKSLMPMEDLCVMGIFEIAKDLPRLLKLIKRVTEEIERMKPDILVTIDLPDFNFRVAAQLKKRGLHVPKMVHYVAPTVWAWRPGRAKKIAKLYDHILCLLPIEPPYFEAEGLSASFVGHPLVQHVKAADGVAFRAAHDIDPKVRTFGLFFGSRRGELSKLGETIEQTAHALLKKYPDTHFIIPTLPHLEEDIRALMSDIEAPFTISTDADQKWNAFAACDAAVAVSGTVGLELAALGVPHVIAYKAGLMTWLMLKALVRVKYAHLANILMEEEIISECLQANCNPAFILSALEGVIDGGQGDKLAALYHMLGGEDEKSPDQKAAGAILNLMQ